MKHGDSRNSASEHTFSTNQTKTYDINSITNKPWVLTKVLKGDSY